MVKAMHILLLAIMMTYAASTAVAANLIPDMLKSYKAEGALHFNAKAGEDFWQQTFPAPEKAENSKPRSCQICHGMDLKKSGEHIRTGKVIDPMALSVNPERFSEAKKIKKWFRRNCKWVLGRTCTAQEKGNILLYLQNQ
jgi:hypothetical protein